MRWLSSRRPRPRRSWDRGRSRLLAMLLNRSTLRHRAHRKMHRHRRLEPRTPRAAFAAVRRRAPKGRFAATRAATRVARPARPAARSCAGRYRPSAPCAVPIRATWARFAATRAAGSARYPAERARSKNAPAPKLQSRSCAAPTRATWARSAAIRAAASARAPANRAAKSLASRFVSSVDVGVGGVVVVDGDGDGLAA